MRSSAVKKAATQTHGPTQKSQVQDRTGQLSVSTKQIRDAHLKTACMDQGRKIVFERGAKEEYLFNWENIHSTEEES